ncbi:MAG: hypothetical protein ABIH21_03315 [Patescibacteria group bacterium]
MWRTISVHKKGETEFLADAIARIEKDTRLNKRADSLLDAATQSEPLIAESFKTPQSAPYHTEGPYLRSHLKLILIVLYALDEEKFHLIDVEEFRQMKGYEGEIDEMEEIIKENISLFESFALCHDVAKWACFSVSSPQGSRGNALGFDVGNFTHFKEICNSEFAAQRSKYIELYEDFAKKYSGESIQTISSLFYKTYQIRCRYPGHGRAIHTPVHHSLLQRVCKASRLTQRDTEMLEDLIAHHLEPISDFKKISPSRISRHLAIAHERGYDADDYIDLLQSCFFLDIVCASKRINNNVQWHEFDLIKNFLVSEHDYSPQKRVEKVMAYEQKKEKEKNMLFRKVRLDGAALLDLLQMEPGPEFGKLLHQIHKSILEDAPMPNLPKEVFSEIKNRAGNFYELMFGKGGDEEE